MLRLERAALNIVDDQVRVPTPARLIAQVTARALESELAARLYYLAPRGETSWHGFAEAIFRQAREHGVTLAINPDTLGRIATQDYPTPAARPLNSRLSLARLEQALKITLPCWQQQLALTLEEHLGE